MSSGTGKKSLCTRRQIDTMLLDDDEFNYDDEDGINAEDECVRTLKQDMRDRNGRGIQTNESDTDDSNDEDPMDDVPAEMRVAIEDKGLNLDVSCGHMKNIVSRVIENVGGTPVVPTCEKNSSHSKNTTAEGAAVYILQRKKDALNCYLRTCCMRLGGEIMM